MDIESPYELIEVKFQRTYPGYLYRRELVDTSEYGEPGDTLEMVCCYSTDTGHWIGNAKIARFLCKKCGLQQVQKTDPEHSVASIGFNVEEQKWYGWSHRAIFGFGIDSVCKKGDCGYGPATVDELFNSITTSDEGGWAWQKPEDVYKVLGGIEIHHEMSMVRGENKDGSLIMEDSKEVDKQFIPTGRGEWTAKTLEEAKQMAIDFANDVS